MSNREEAQHGERTKSNRIKPLTPLGARGTLIVVRAVPAAPQRIWAEVFVEHARYTDPGHSGSVWRNSRRGYRHHFAAEGCDAAVMGGPDHPSALLCRVVGHHRPQAKPTEPRASADRDVPGHFPQEQPLLRSALGMRPPQREPTGGVIPDGVRRAQHPVTRRW